MVRLGDPVPNALATARELSAVGLQVFPARYRDKVPIVKWEKFIGKDSSSMVEGWFKNRGSLNFWVMTGQQSGYVVIDCDSQEGYDWWFEHLGEDLENTARVRTHKGSHHWFKLGQPLESWGVHPKKEDKHKISFDVRADKTGIIVPPSVHETGLVYKWEIPLDAALPAPPGVLDGSIRREAPVATGDASGGAAGVGAQTRSLLSRLLSRPPGGEGSGRNDWLARVAGHYAKTYHNQQDLYEAHCVAANNMMGTPLGQTEFTKTITSVWKGEHDRNRHRAVDADVGFLTSGNTKLLCQIRIKKGEDDVDYDFVEYADFDLRAKGVMTDEAGRRTYWAEVVRRKRGTVDEEERFDIVLRAEILGDDRAFRKYLAAYACTVVPPDNMFPKTGGPGVRIQRYLESQHPPVVEITPALGFHPTALGSEGAYVTHEGGITSAGTVGVADMAVRADPRLRVSGTAPHHYGFVENEVIARDTLREILTFHEESVTSVFGAWWAACLLKPQIEERTSLFPFMAVEAPSESGKTNGFFQMMTQMNGNTRGETQPTKAALRDMAAAHRNGIVWIDDLDDPAYLMELLRAATSGGSLTKMGEDRESIKSAQIVSPIVISGEALGLGTQKALVDRAIILKAGSPVGRRSLHDPAVPQWEDILAVRAKYPEGLADLAGWFVQDSLGHADRTLTALATGRAGGSGRSADKIAVLRAGAHLLDHLIREGGAWLGRGMHTRRVETWLKKEMLDADGLPIINNENALTLELLPWALRHWKFPEKPLAGEKSWEPDYPVFIKGWQQQSSGEWAFFGDGPVIGFNAAGLAEAWEKSKYGRNEKRTTTEAAIRDQAKVLGLRSKRQRIANSTRLAYFFKIDGDLAHNILRRALSQ